ncbi:MAG: M81 family metallopeptidase [Candidatus Acidiferrales bacterium]
MIRTKLRIAVGQISSESNHFVSAPCELDLFHRSGYVFEGAELFKLKSTTTELAGVLTTLEAADNVEIIPLLAARGISSGPLSESCYTHLKGRLLSRLKEAGSVDGVLLSHHGSMAAINEDDTEGDIGLAVRGIIGPTKSFVMTLDLHANVTDRMVDATNAIVGYEHYPHDDAYSTGVRAARLLLMAARGETRPVIGHAKLSLLLTSFNASTVLETPYARLMQEAKCLESEPGVLSTSVFFVGSYIDVPDIGCSCVVVADGDSGLAANLAKRLAEKFWDVRRQFEVETFSVAEAVRQGRKIEGGPVLLLDTADTTGGGASGDSIGLVKGFLDAGVTETCLATVVDPQAAAACIEAGVGSIVSVQLGHKLDPAWGMPIGVTGKVVRVSDGRFQYTGGIHGGTWACMGPSAVLAIGSVQVLVMTSPTYDWADEQYRCMGMDPEKSKFVGVKNMMNFRFGYRNLMKGFFVLDLPGPTPPDMRMLTFRRIARPWYPLDENLSQPEIRVSLSR